MTTSASQQVDAFQLPGPYCTVAQAARWLQVSPDTVTRRLVPPDQVRAVGQIGYRRVGSLRAIRILSADVYAMLPPADRTGAPV